MGQLGNLVIVCAQRSDVKLWIQRGVVYVNAGAGCFSKVMTAARDDDKKISKIIHELNFGAYAPKANAPQEKEAA